MTMLGRNRRSADKKAKEAARRAEELAEQAKQAAEEAKAAVRATDPEPAPEDGPTPEAATESASETDGAETVAAAAAAPRGKSVAETTRAETAEAAEPSAAQKAARRAEELAERAAQAAEEARLALLEASAAAEAEATATDEAEATVGAGATAVDSGVAADEDADEDEAAGEGGGWLAEGEDELEPAEVPDGGKPRRVSVRGGLSWAGVVLILVCLVLAVASGWLWTKDRALGDKEKAREQVAFAATQAAQDLSSYDYRTLDSDFRRAASRTTGKFRTQFEAETQRIKTNAQQQQMVVDGTAIKTAIEESSQRRAVALVFLNQQTVKTAKAERLPSQFTLRLTMKKIGGRWLVEELKVL